MILLFALSVLPPLAEIVETVNSLEMSVRVIESFENGPIILDLSTTNRGKKPLFFKSIGPADSYVVVPKSWTVRNQSGCAGTGSSQVHTLEPGQSLTSRHRLHLDYLNPLPAGKHSIKFIWPGWSLRNKHDHEVQMTATLGETFDLTVTPATVRNRKALNARLEAEFTLLPPPGKNDGREFGYGRDHDPFRDLCEKVVFTPHKELVPLVLRLLERCPVGNEVLDGTYSLRRDLVGTLFAADPEVASHSLIDRLITAPPRVEPTAVFDVWQTKNWWLPDTVTELVTNALNPYWWISPPFGEQLNGLETLIRGISLYAPLVLPESELLRLSTAKDFWVRAMVYATFVDRLTPEWGDAYLKGVRERFAPKLTAKQVEELIHKLGDEEFAVREKAEAKLSVHRWEVGPALAQATRENDSPEVRKRAQAILDRIKPHPPKGPASRVLRSLSPRRPADRKLLETLAAGVKENPVCKEAREILADPKR